MCARTEDTGVGELPEDLAGWIAALRRRLQQGELESIGFIHVCDGVSMTATLTAKIVLADLDDHIELHAQGTEPTDTRPWVQLLKDINQLRALVR